MTTSRIAFADLTSHGVHPKVGAANRLDPYWDGLWASGALASWVSAESAARQERAGLARVPAPLAMDPQEAWEKFVGGYGWRRKLEVLGVLGSWRTLSAEQLAAFVGAPSIAGRSRLMDAAFACGLVDHGIFTSGLVRTHLSSRAKLFRPSGTDVFAKRVAPMLTYPELTLVTGGRKFKTGGQYDRHNLLTSELALRVAEFCDVGTVLGETYSTVDLLLGSGIGKPPIVKRNQSADATIVRADGMRVAVEITASVASLKEKVHRWAERMSTDSFARTGLNILFVGAPPPDRPHGRSQDEFLRILRKTIRRVLAEYPGVPGANLADRFWVAMWEDWFPAPGMVTESFLTLRAHRLSPGARAPWREAGILDEFEVPFEPHDPAAMTAVLSGAATVASPPVWLRRRYETVPLHRYAMAKGGFDSVPVPHPQKPPAGAGQATPAARTSVARASARLSNAPSPDEGAIS